MPVERSELIATVEEAREYYRARLVRSHQITCAGATVTVVFQFDATHLYSTTHKGGAIPAGAQVVTQQIGEGESEVRLFNLDRARLMDHILPAISDFKFSIPGKKVGGRLRRVLHGPELPDGRHMRVVLREGPKSAWTCVSAFPVTKRDYEQARRSETAKFP